MEYLMAAIIVEILDVCNKIKIALSFMDRKICMSSPDQVKEEETALVKAEKDLQRIVFDLQAVVSQKK